MPSQYSPIHQKISDEKMNIKKNLTLLIQNEMGLLTVTNDEACSLLPRQQLLCMPRIGPELLKTLKSSEMRNWYTEIIAMDMLTGKIPAKS